MTHGLPNLIWLHDEIRVDASHYLVNGLIEPGSLVVAYGAPGAGKSTVAIDLGMCIAQGMPWRDRDTNKGLVLHIAGEGVRGLRMRQLAWMARHGAPPTLPYAILPGAVDLESAQTQRDMVSSILEAASSIGEVPALVIVDTLARCLSGDENSSLDMGRVIAGCDAIRAETGASVLLIHHAGKDLGKGARGHSSLRAAADTELLIEGQANPRALSVKKQRDLELGEPMAFRLEQVVLPRHPESDQLVTSVVVDHDERVPVLGLTVNGKHQRAVLAALKGRFEETGSRYISDAELRELLRTTVVDRRRVSEVQTFFISASVLVPTDGGYDVNLGITY